MTAKELLNKRKFNPDEPITLSESEVEDLMNEFVLHIAEQAVGEVKKEKIEADLHDAGWNGACNVILTRIKKLTQTNEDK